RLLVDLGSHKCRQKIGRARRNQMGSVELGGNMHTKVKPAPFAFHQLPFRNGAQEIATETDKGTHPAIDDGFTCLHRVHTIFARRLEVELLGHSIKRHQFYFFRNTDGPLTLDIGVTAHGTDTCTTFANLPPHQKKIDQHLHVVDAQLVLSEPHAVNGDH